MNQCASQPGGRDPLGDFQGSCKLSLPSQQTMVSLESRAMHISPAWMSSDNLHQETSPEKPALGCHSFHKFFFIFPAYGDESLDVGQCDKSA